MPNPVSRETRWQAVSGLVFGTFLVLHLAGTAVAALGQETFDSALGWARRYYQFPAIEIGVVGVAGLLHISIGIRRALRRRAQARSSAAPAPPTPGWLRWHRRTGWFLVLVIVGHVLATRGPGLFLGQPVDFAYMSFSLTVWPYVMYPYYFVLFGCGAFHLVHGALVALHVTGMRAVPPGGRATRVAFAVALLAGAAGILSMGGVYGPAVDATRYDEFRDLYERFAPFMVTW